VKFFFQPAEEGQGGARFMIEDGALEGVDQAYGIHLWNYQKYGTVGVKPGPIMAAADIFEITIHGKGGHGAAPQGTKDAVLIAAHLIQTLQTIVSRNTNPIESTVVTVGQINGGYNFNIIADRVSLKVPPGRIRKKTVFLLRSVWQRSLPAQKKRLMPKLILIMKMAILLPSMIRKQQKIY